MIIGREVLLKMGDEFETQFEVHFGEKQPDYIGLFLSSIANLSEDERVERINDAREAIHEASPFKNEPVDFVKWVKNSEVYANDYNPNSVAPPEMKLLERSIDADGYTQPIVSWPTDKGREVVDGFHRHRVGKESSLIQSRVKGYLPVVSIRGSQEDLNNRMAATVRHNRARGKHNVDSMSDMVVELKRRNWSNKRIMSELGMDEDEVLRLCQITGMAELFSDQEFSSAWDVSGDTTEDDFEDLRDEVEEIAEFAGDTRVVNSDDDKRVFHTYDKWECYKAGFYDTTFASLTKEAAELAYKDFLSNENAFRNGLEGVIANWKNSCEHYLTNSAMNRIAWLGQAAACYSLGIPSRFRSGFNLLNETQKNEANLIALEYLKKWLGEEITLDEAMGGGRQSDIY